MAPTRIIAVRLTPKASSEPDNGKANEAMIRLLAKHLDVPASHLTIMRGQTHRNKPVRIE